MLVLWFTLSIVRATLCIETLKMNDDTKYSYMKSYVTPLEEFDNVAHWGDAEHRGPRWYDESSDITPGSDIESGVTDTSSSIESDISPDLTTSSSASSAETELERQSTRKYRTCKPCPQDMLKKHTNIGIKWICAGYQRARRTFKSECMMRYRNCEDGTMFTKLYDHKCKDDSFHGRHWFYEYRI